MSRLYRKFDGRYADKCLQHARYAFAYAKAHPGTEGTKDGSFYPANARWQDDYVIAASELYWATGEAAFLEEAESRAANVLDHNYTLCYNNNDDLAAYNLALLGLADKQQLLERIVNRYKGGVTAAGVGNIGDQWGRLRFPLNQAFAAGLLGKLKSDAGVDPFAWKNLDYVLGKNDADQSFLVGFGDKAPQHPHHRNVFLSDANPANKNSLAIPARNRQAGILMGGTLSPGEFKDDVETYVNTEGCIDYNAGLVATLGYILSKLAPVDTNKFNGGVGLAPAPKAGLRSGSGRKVDGLGRRLPIYNPGVLGAAPATPAWSLPGGMPPSPPRE
jgi:hypothetical protein